MPHTKNRNAPDLWTSETSTLTLAPSIVKAPKRVPGTVGLNQNKSRGSRFWLGVTAYMRKYRYKQIRTQKLQRKLVDCGRVWGYDLFHFMSSSEHDTAKPRLNLYHTWMVTFQEVVWWCMYTWPTKINENSFLYNNMYDTQMPLYGETESESWPSFEAPFSTWGGQLCLLITLPSPLAPTSPGEVRARGLVRPA